MKKLFSISPLIFACSFSLSAAPLQFDVSAEYTIDDNITRAELDRDIEEDTILSVAASASMRIALNDMSYFSLAGSLALNHYMDFSKLDNNRVGLQGSYHIRPSPGYTAIRYFVQLGIEQRMYDSELRESSVTQYGLGLGKRLTDLVSMRLGYSKENIDADHDVFDADNGQFYIDFEYRLGDSNNLYLTLSQFDGEIVATTVPTTKVIQSSSGIVRDDAFLGLLPERFAYKLSATTNAIRLGDNFAIDHRQTLDGSVFFYDSSASGDNDYSGMILSISYLLSF